MFYFIPYAIALTLWSFNMFWPYFYPWHFCWSLYLVCFSYTVYVGYKYNLRWKIWLLVMGTDLVYLRSLIIILFSIEYLTNLVYLFNLGYFNSFLCSLIHTQAGTFFCLLVPDIWGYIFSGYFPSSSADISVSVKSVISVHVYHFHGISTAQWD